MIFAAFRRRLALVVESLAAAPIHGLERNADGVILHIAVRDAAPVTLELPRRHAAQLRDYLVRAVEALDHWEESRKTLNASRLTIAELDLPPARRFDDEGSFGYEVR